MESDRVRMRRPDEVSFSEDKRSLEIIKTSDEPLPLWGQVHEFLGGPWVRLIIFVLVCFFTAPLYYGWQQYSLMLGRSGAYSWLCDPNDSMIDDVYLCAAQEKAIGNLYSIAAGCEYASAAWGGIFLDSLGPRMSGLIGELGWVIGTVLIMLSSQSVQLYIPGMIILGSSVNIVMFPSLVTIESWPQWRGLMVGVALAASTAATLIPPVMWALWEANPDWTFKAIWAVYIAAIWVPMTVLYVIALPGVRDYQKILKVQRQELLALKAKTQEEGDNSSQPEIRNEYAEIDGPLAVREATWGEFARNILTVDMIVMGIYFFVMMGMYAYYPTVVRSAIGSKFSDFVGWIQPTQAIWSLMVGLLCDWFRTPWVMTGMCACLALVFIISVAGSDGHWSHYISAAILIISQCAIFEVKFTYVSEMFDPYHYGKLVGFLGVVGGIGTFLNIPIANSTAYDTVFITYTCLMPLLIAMSSWLGWRQVKGHHYKTLPNAEDQQPMLLDSATVFG